ncbi:MAG: DUF4389 domain-containing protein [Pseudomonadota bacterium]|nr:MAG: DUF4389 domain-containing protein [Pseudomonadota bacterium]
MSDREIKKNIKAHDTWLRGFFILIFAIIWSLAEIVLAALVVFQFVSLLLTAGTNERLLEFSRSLCTYIYEIARYVTFNEDERPYPFAPWPSGAVAPRRKSPVRKKRAAAKPTDSSPPATEPPSQE